MRRMWGGKGVKVLNLYAGIGGNRKLWTGCEVTAIEINPEIGNIYKDFFPDDKMIVGDAHEHLLNHYNEYDFIWSSPPCPTHSRARFWGWSKKRPVYPDMRLYQEIIFLQHHFKGSWVVENVKPYYDYFYNPVEIGRHLFWSNFTIEKIEHKSSDIRKLSGTSKKDKMIRNMVDHDIGLHIYNCAKDKNYEKPTIQGKLF